MLGGLRGSSHVSESVLSSLHICFGNEKAGNLGARNIQAAVHEIYWPSIPLTRVDAIKFEEDKHFLHKGRSFFSSFRIQLPLFILCFDLCKLCCCQQQTMFLDSLNRREIRRRTRRKRRMKKASNSLISLMQEDSHWSGW